jgi:predicted nucleotidyltransferase
MQPIEGCLVESVENIIFDVKGLVHPPNKVVAFPRFIPDFKGLRQRGKDKYRKVYSISERFKFLEKNLPDYVVYDTVFDEKLCELPLEKVKKVYNPVNRLERLRKSRNLKELEALALQCLKILKEEANVPWSKLGVSGSLLVGLHTEMSDIDLVVYGEKNCWKIHSALRKLLEEGNKPFKSYNLEDLKRLFNFRSKDTIMSLKDFVKVESRKIFQGKFMGRDFFVRFVKDLDEVDEDYGEVRYKNCGYAKIEATVVDDAESIFTPCIYKIDDVKVVDGPKLHPLKEIASFRGRFCEQARKGERVVAQGKIEHITDYRRKSEHFRLLIGNKPSDYMILKTR